MKPFKDSTPDMLM